MKLKRILTGAAAALLLAGTGAAQANSAKSLSLSQSPAIDRASTAVSESNQATGGFLIPVLAVIAIVGVILIVSGGDDSDSP